MKRRLRREEVVTIQVLRERDEAAGDCSPARVDEKGVRYRLRRLAEGAGDGRCELIRPLPAAVGRRPPSRQV